MDLTTYQPLAMRTAKPFPTLALNLAHAAIGIATESFEMIQALDVEHWGEEAFDLMWYVNLGADTLDVSLAKIEVEVDEDANIEVFIGGFLNDAKRIFVYGRELTPEMHQRMVQNLGSIVGWIRASCRRAELDFDAGLQANIDKLRLRFPEKYSDEAAEARADKGGLEATVS